MKGRILVPVQAKRKTNARTVDNILFIFPPLIVISASPYSGDSKLISKIHITAETSVMKHYLLSQVVSGVLTVVADHSQ